MFVLKSKEASNRDIPDNLSNKDKKHNVNKLEHSKRRTGQCRRPTKDFISYKSKFIRLKPPTKEKIEHIMTTKDNLYYDRDNDVEEKIIKFDTNNIETKYSYIEDSLFKRDFLKIINGNFQQNLEKSVLSNIDVDRNDNLDICLLIELNEKRLSDEYKKNFKFRKTLPIYENKEEILNLVEKNQVILICGNTGSGKTTQVAQFILDHEIERNRGSSTSIVCTSPRRISAISVAERVAAERADKLGNSVGYHIRLESKLPRSSGSILFCTTAMILQYMQNDPSLQKYSHIILDEIHERSKYSDLVITLLKQIVIKRPGLKVILMSATLDHKKFSNYLNECPILHISGFTYPVEVCYFEAVLKLARPYLSDTEFQFILKTLASKSLSTNIPVTLIVALIRHISNNEGPGAILVFFPGVSAIQELHEALTNCQDFKNSDKYVIYPLVSTMPTMDQKSVFEKAESNVRKIIISTNIAESSITIEDVVYVIDSGKEKRIKMRSDLVERLEEHWISKASAEQRKGRAGRVQPGKCYRLFTEERYTKLDDYALPEILESSLEELILQMKIIQIGKVIPFFATLMDSPSTPLIVASIDLLKQLKALDINETLTPLGYHLARLDVHPRIGKMLIWSTLFSCIEPIFAIAACLSLNDPFYSPINDGERKKANDKKIELDGDLFSDLLIYAKVLKVFQEEKTLKNKHKFCETYFLSYHRLKTIVRLQEDFVHILHKMRFLEKADKKDFSANKNSYNQSLLRAILCIGVYPSVAAIIEVGCKKNAKKNRFCVCTTAGLSGYSSTNSERTMFPSPYLIYFSKKIYDETTYLIDTTCVSSVALLFAEPSANTFSNDKFTEYRPADITQMLKALFLKLDNLLNYKICQPKLTDWNTSAKEFIKVTIQLLSDYDEFIGLESGRRHIRKKVICDQKNCKN